MRVALLSRGAHPLHGPGGMERAVFDLARHLQARGVETVLFTRKPARPGEFPGEVVTVDYGPERGHGRVLDRTLRYPRFAERVGRLVAERVRTGRVDLVDAQGLTALGYGRQRQRDRALVAPLVMNPQGMEEHKARGLKRLALTRLRALSREAARLADCVVATDEATRPEVESLLGVSPDRVAVLPNGIDLAEVDRLTPADAGEVAHSLVPALAGSAPVLLSVARLEAYKGLDQTLDALRLVAADGGLPAGWAWLVVGAGAERERLRGRLGTAFAGHVHFTGAVSEPMLHALYARADAFVHATLYEGSSLVTLEAMAHGLPVLATRVGGIPDKVVEGETGWLVPPGDVEALARGLREIARDVPEARAKGERGRQRVRERFAWSVLVDRTIALYEELLRA